MALGFVHSVSVVGAGVGFVTTPSMVTTSGNLIVADITYYAAGGGFSSLTDSVGLSWSESIAAITPSGGGSNNLSRQRYAENITGNASHTFTFNSTGTDYPALAVREISGALTSGSLAETVTDVAQTTSPYSLGLTTSAPADKILCAYGSCDAVVGGSVTQTGTFIQNDNIGVTAVNEQLLSSYKIISATGTNTFSFTVANNEAYAIAIAAFTAAVVVKTPLPWQQKGQMGALLPQ